MNDEGVPRGGEEGVEAPRRRGLGRVPGFVWLLLAIPFTVLLAFVPWGRLLRGAPPAEFTNGLGMKFVRIGPGEFLMGSPGNEPESDAGETPHRVKITKGFFLQATEVTQKQWRLVMGNDPSNFKGDDLPVEQVSWDDAAEFCQKVSAKEAGGPEPRRGGKTYRLPTEAEWEYACRAGSKGSYAGTGKLDDMGWHEGNSGGKTHDVGQKRPNAWGLYDMHGNVWEWCADWYGEYGGGAETDPTGPGSGTARVHRGGCWFYYPRYCRSAYRYRYAPGIRYNINGFRPAVDF